MQIDVYAKIKERYRNEPGWYKKRIKREEESRNFWCWHSRNQSGYFILGGGYRAFLKALGSQWIVFVCLKIISSGFRIPLMPRWRRVFRLRKLGIRNDISV
jgi:hypothetical protein